jgi:hypothetical protein
MVVNGRGHAVTYSRATANSDEQAVRTKEAERRRRES